MFKGGSSTPVWSDVYGTDVSDVYTSRGQTDFYTVPVTMGVNLRGKTKRWGL